MNRRLLALLLVLAMVFSLFGCTADPGSTQPPTTEAPTEPPVTEAPELTAYREARAAVDEAAQLSIRLTATKTTSVGGESFTEKSTQTLRCSGLGTDSILYASEEDVTYGSGYSVSYSEIFAEGTLYVTVDDTYLYSGALSAEDCARRYAPAVLLDAGLYGSTAMDGSVITFSEPTAAEAWAMPEDAEMLSASGSAVLSSAGELQKTAYTITYRYGPAEITLEAEAYVTIEPVTVEAPASPDAYIPLEYVDAPRLSEMALGYLFEAEAANLSSISSTMSQAAGVILNQSSVIDTYGSGTDLQAKIETNVYLMNYSTNQSQEVKQVELFRDGKFTVATDGGEPQEQSGITASMIQEYCDEQKGTNMISFDYWQNAAATDLGSLYLLELTLNEQFGSNIQSNICYSLFGDMDLLNNLASGYVSNELTAYISIDKYTGLPTAAGYYFEGTHTIDGQECILSQQIDQAIDAPCVSAYYNITEEMLPEEEPEQKASPLFYHVTGENGQEMWLFGTIHVGDNRTAYLPQEIFDALAASSALAIECDNDGFEDLYDSDESIQNAVSEAYYYSDGSTIQDHIDPELYESAVNYMKATGGYNMNAEYAKPYLWYSGIDEFYLRQGYQLTRDQGIEERLTNFAEENDIPLREVESCLFQIQLLTGLPDALQELMLEETISIDAQENWEGTMELLDLWCSGDEEALRERISCEVDLSELTEEELAEYEEVKDLLDEYNDAISHNRNDGMLEVLTGYLESGDTVFVAVGLAHLLDETNGLVDTLREAGYTVELVEYAG